MIRRDMVRRLGTTVVALFGPAVVRPAEAAPPEVNEIVIDAGGKTVVISNCVINKPIRIVNGDVTIQDTVFNVAEGSSGLEVDS